jgi:hypothetical protein
MNSDVQRRYLRSSCFTSDCCLSCMMCEIYVNYLYLIISYLCIRRLCFSDLFHIVIIWAMCMTNIKRIRVIYHVPGGSGVMVLNAPFNNFWVISWRSVFIGEWNQSIRRNPDFIAWCCIEYTLPRERFELTELVVIGTDCIGSCKSNHHTITTTTAPRAWSI